MELTVFGLTLTLPQLLAAQALGSGLLLATFGWRQRTLRRQLAQLRTQLETLPAQPSVAAPVVSPVAPAAAAEPFAGALRQAELQGRLHLGAVHRGAPEKYRYVAALAEQGLSPAQIGQALHLAPAEVEQAVRLTRLRRDCRDANGIAANGR